MAPLIVGLSGPTCSGKTTLARYLQSIFPRTAILHEDDFYISAAQLPYRAGHQNWDCAAAIDQGRLIEALEHIRQRGSLPSGLDSKEEYEGLFLVDEKVIAELRSDVGDSAGGKPSTDQSAEGLRCPSLVIVDGFLLFGKSMPKLRDIFELRIQLTGRYEDIKSRREGRKGYVTDEGFWEDPEGYFDDVVWVEYVEEHAFLFENGDVNGAVDEECAQREDIRCSRDTDMQRLLRWTVSMLNASLNDRNLA